MAAKKKPTQSSAKRSAAESTDPTVHRLLAERQTATLNGDHAAAKAVDKQLSELGYE